MADATCLAELTALFQAEKSAGSVPAWSDQETPAGRRLYVACPLWIGEQLISGLRLEIHGPQATPSDRPFFGLTALLFATHRGKTYHLGRIEFDPVSPVGPHHRNPMTARSLPPTITGPHIHPFEENAALGLGSLSPTGDLPIARSLDKPCVTFAEILTTISENFNIPGLWLEEPGWSRTLV
ncbi:hypothetical protein ACN9MC_04770 [Ensifer adhaerens]|uniref:hypothetical protein n=1 Tax=Ensifer adhaerens TaxID=106592 RepID=UPI003CF2B3AD